MGRVVFLGTVLAGVVAMVVAAWIVTVERSQSPTGGRSFGALPVEVVTVEAHEFADIVEALGTARSNESVTITSRSTDVISRVAFESGDRVEVGQILVEFADAEEAADLEEARASLLEVERELVRVRELAQRGVVAQSQVDSAEASVDRAASRLASVQAQQADLLIRAPFDGLVGLRNASPGMLVRPGDPIASLDDVSIIKVDFTIPERFLTVLAAGDALVFTAAAYPGRVFEGYVAQVDTRVDPITRAATVRALIDNSDGKILPGMLMLVEARSNERQSTAVPELAVVRNANTAFVYVVDDDGEGAPTARRQNVNTGERRNGLIEVTNGLQPGARIVSEGVHRVRPGSPIRIAGEDDVDGNSVRSGAGATR